MLIPRHRQLGIVCFLAWLGTGLIFWMWHNPAPRRMSLRGISQEGTPFFLSADGRYLGTAMAEPMPAGAYVTKGGQLVPDTPDHPLALCLWDVDTEQKYFQVREPRAAGYMLSSDATHLAIVTLDRRIKVWKIETNEMQVLDMPGFWGQNLAFSPNGAILAVGGWYPNREEQRNTDVERDSVRVWDLVQKKELTPLPGPKSLSALVFTPDGRQLAMVGGHAPRADFFDWATGHLAITYHMGPHTYDRGTGALFVPDGRTLAVFNGRQIYLADDGTDGQCRQWLEDGVISAAAFSPNGRFLVVHCTGIAPDRPRSLYRISPTLAARLYASTDRTLLLDSQTGETVDSLPAATHLAFRPDGKTLVTYSRQEDAVQLWNFPPRPGPWVWGWPLGIAGTFTAFLWLRWRLARGKNRRPEEQREMVA